MGSRLLLGAYRLAVAGAAAASAATGEPAGPAACCGMGMACGAEEAAASWTFPPGAGAAGIAALAAAGIAGAGAEGAAAAAGIAALPALAAGAPLAWNIPTEDAAASAAAL